MASSDMLTYALDKNKLFETAIKAAREGDLNGIKSALSKHGVIVNKREATVSNC